ncbi:serine/arginine-rich splicing factor 2-like [Trichechus manatus latirostris]|uniref:Serine/arginine-rich splicing factor 2 n=1 Tax=Trichechus manatus latirostris TaxID=127582 RepID=A0A2Y9G2E6_TRIMA|nr:serine/arginine-rich splicing factor 2-like [Trichechus manatus latirostris]
MSYGRSPPNVEGMTSLKVDNLTYRTSPNTLRRIFEKYGSIGDVYIPRNHFTKESRGFAFVRFYYKCDAEDAMDALDGVVLDGRELRVQMARYGRPTDPYYGRRGRPSRRYKEDDYENKSRRPWRPCPSRSCSRSRFRSRSRSRISLSKSWSRSRSCSRLRRRSRSTSTSRSTRRSRSRSSSVSRSRSLTKSRSRSRSRSLPAGYRKEYKSRSRSRSLRKLPEEEGDLSY